MKCHAFTLWMEKKVFLSILVIFLIRQVFIMSMKDKKSRRYSALLICKFSLYGWHWKYFKSFMCFKFVHGCNSTLLLLGWPYHLNHLKWNVCPLGFSTKIKVLYVLYNIPPKQAGTTEFEVCCFYKG